MKLRLYTDADLALTDRLETDPKVMRHLGGPQDADGILKAHRRRSSPVEGGDWWYVIEIDGTQVGTIGVWPYEGDLTEHEVGWIVAPEFHGRGIATEALAMLLGQIRADSRFGRVHAFPGIANEASNALCRRAGFELVGEETAPFRGEPFQCNHWVVES